MSGLGLGCVKTPTFNQRIEIPSRFRQFENQKYLRLLLAADDRENNSAHFWRVHVFTRPGSNRYQNGVSARRPLYRTSPGARPTSAKGPEKIERRKSADEQKQNIQTIHNGSTIIFLFRLQWLS
jgi:hypothetical protein